jgi:hypothetical protein
LGDLSGNLGCYRVAKGIELIKEGLVPAAWVSEMLASGKFSFYSIKEELHLFHKHSNKVNGFLDRMHLSS